MLVLLVKFHQVINIRGSIFGGVLVTNIKAYDQSYCNLLRRWRPFVAGKSLLFTNLTKRFGKYNKIFMIVCIPCRCTDNSVLFPMIL